MELSIIMVISWKLHGGSMVVYNRICIPNPPWNYSFSPMFPLANSKSIHSRMKKSSRIDKNYHISSDPHTDTLCWYTFWPISWKYIYIDVAGSRHRFSDILADILSGILSDILFDIYFWHSTRHIFWHSFWRSFWHPIVTFFLTFFLWHFIWHMFWHSICQSFCICSDILCSGPAVVHCIRSPRYGLDRFMPTVTTSWQWRRRRRRIWYNHINI